MSFDVAAVREELRKWFFDGYLPHGIALLNGDDPGGADAFLQYWGRPLFFCSDVTNVSAWLMTDEEVRATVQRMNDTLLARGYRNTIVPDSRIFVYNANGGAVEVIWSRQDGDGREVQRVAVHFHMGRVDGQWRYVSIQSRTTTPEVDGGALEGAWNA